jgi:hypothetical protein
VCDLERRRRGRRPEPRERLTEHHTAFVGGTLHAPITRGTSSVALRRLQLVVMDPAVVEAQTRAIRATSVEEKLRVAESLRAFAWEVTRAAVRRRNPGLSDAEVLRRVRAAFGHDRA